MSALRRLEPANQLEQMRRMFENVVGRGMLGPLGLAPEVFAPKVEVFETDREVVVSAELSGLDPEDVNVEITEDAVILSGESKLTREIKEDNYFHSERQYGRFERVIPLPDRIKDQEAKATFKNGLLTIRAPLVEAMRRQQPHKVQVTRE